MVFLLYVWDDLYTVYVVDVCSYMVSNSITYSRNCVCHCVYACVCVSMCLCLSVCSTQFGQHTYTKVAHTQ